MRLAKQSLLVRKLDSTSLSRSKKKKKKKKKKIENSFQLSKKVLEILNKMHGQKTGIQEIAAKFSHMFKGAQIHSVTHSDVKKTVFFRSCFLYEKIKCFF